MIPQFFLFAMSVVVKLIIVSYERDSCGLMTEDCDLIIQMVPCCISYSNVWYLICKLMCNIVMSCNLVVVKFSRTSEGSEIEKGLSKSRIRTIILLPAYSIDGYNQTFDDVKKTYW